MTFVFYNKNLIVNFFHSSAVQLRHKKLEKYCIKRAVLEIQYLCSESTTWRTVVQAKHIYMQIYCGLASGIAMVKNIKLGKTTLQILYNMTHTWFV